MIMMMMMMMIVLLSLTVKAARNMLRVYGVGCSLYCESSMLTSRTVLCLNRDLSQRHVLPVPTYR